MRLECQRRVRQCHAADEAEPVRLSGVDLYNGESGRRVVDDAEVRDRLPVYHDPVGLAGPGERVRVHPLLDLGVSLVPQAVDEDGALAVGWIRPLALVFDDQGTRCGDGLEPDVAVVEVCSGRAIGDLKFVVEEVLWWDRPLGGEWRPVRKGGSCLSEAMPMLYVIWIQLAHTLEDLDNYGKMKTNNCGVLLRHVIVDSDPDHFSLRESKLGCWE